MGSLVDLIVHVVLGQAHVHVGPVGDKGDGSVKLLGVVGEGVGDSVLLVVVGEDGGDDELLVVGAKVSAAYSSSTLSSTQASLLLVLITLQSA